MTVQVKHVTASATGQWWVINTSPPSGTPTIYTVLEGTQAQADNIPDGGGVSEPHSEYSSVAVAIISWTGIAAAGAGVRREICGLHGALCG